ncbi:5'/3'-nucleotidase SurE [cyanobacterium TDX16]|nr:5'/3'-nucleotidase SurE [cyanobacterium TDX16]
MRILLTNDDGIFAPGIIAMHDELQRNHDVTVVAPANVQSGGSHAITIRNPVLWRSVSVNDRFRGTSVEGTPADCVKLAIGALMPEKPDLVVSGINSGLNTGVHVLYSGTVAAAVEGAILGCPAVAVSLELYRDMDYPRAARITGRIIEDLFNDSLENRLVWNVNIPEFKADHPRGVRVAAQCTLPTLDRLEKRSDPSGREYYWLGGDWGELDDGGDTDLHVVRQGYVCVTPLRFNLTAVDAMDAARGRAWKSVTFD